MFLEVFFAIDYGGREAIVVSIVCSVHLFAVYKLTKISEKGFNLVEKSKIVRR